MNKTEEKNAQEQLEKEIKEKAGKAEIEGRDNGSSDGRK